MEIPEEQEEALMTLDGEEDTAGKLLNLLPKNKIDNLSYSNRFVQINLNKFYIPQFTKLKSNLCK